LPRRYGREGGEEALAADALDGLWDEHAVFLALLDEGGDVFLLRL